MHGRVTAERAAHEVGGHPGGRLALLRPLVHGDDVGFGHPPFELLKGRDGRGRRV